MEHCKTVAPPLRQLGSGHFAACHLYDSDLNHDFRKDERNVNTTA
jgi:hypothetical protein